MQSNKMSTELRLSEIRVMLILLSYVIAVYQNSNIAPRGLYSPGDIIFRGIANLTACIVKLVVRALRQRNMHFSDELLRLGLLWVIHIDFECWGRCDFAPLCRDPLPAQCGVRLTELLIGAAVDRDGIVSAADRLEANVAIGFDVLLDDDAGVVTNLIRRRNGRVVRDTGPAW